MKERTNASRVQPTNQQYKRIHKLKLNAFPLFSRTLTTYKIVCLRQCNDDDDGLKLEEDKCVRDDRKSRKVCLCKWFACA